MTFLRSPSTYIVKGLPVLPATLLLMFATGCDQNEFAGAQDNPPPVFPLEARGLWTTNTSDTTATGLPIAELDIGTTDIAFCSDINGDGTRETVRGNLQAVNGDSYQVRTIVDSLREDGINPPSLTVTADTSAGTATLSADGTTYQPEVAGVPNASGTALIPTELCQ